MIISFIKEAKNSQMFQLLKYKDFLFLSIIQYAMWNEDSLEFVLLGAQEKSFEDVALSFWLWAADIVLKWNMLKLKN